MTNEEVERLIQAGLPEVQVQVGGDGRHFEAVVIGEVFSGQSLVQRQRVVMATVRPQIESDELHALSIRTYTPEEWARLAS